VRRAAADFVEKPDAGLREHVRDAGQIAASAFLGYDGRTDDPHIICETNFLLMAHGGRAARREIVSMRSRGCGGGIEVSNPLCNSLKLYGQESTQFPRNLLKLLNYSTPPESAKIAPRQPLSSEESRSGNLRKYRLCGLRPPERTREGAAEARKMLHRMLHNILNIAPNARTRDRR
jgi:hypothetical protein